MVENKNSLNIFITFPLGAKEEMSRLDELFLRGKYHPVADQSKILTEILAIPLDNKRKGTQNKTLYNIILIILHNYYITYFVLLETKEKPTKKGKNPQHPNQRKGTIISDGTQWNNPPKLYLCSIHGCPVYNIHGFSVYSIHSFPVYHVHVTQR